MRLTGGLLSSGTGGGGGGGGGGVDPTFLAAGAHDNGAGSISLPLPTGHAADDILLILLETAGSAAAPVPPTGYASILNSPSQDLTGTTAQQTRLSIFWKRDSGSETSPVALADAGDHQMGVILAFRNCIQTGNPWDTTAAGSAGSATTAISCPTVTTTGANRLILAVASTSIENDSTTEFSGWTNANLVSVTEIVDFTESNGDGGGIGAAYGMKLVAGATGATTATAANAERHAYLTVALKGQT